jgi:hypothetical protein
MSHSIKIAAKVLAISLAITGGMFFGAVILFVFAGGIYQAIYTPCLEINSYDCAPGPALGLFSLLGGGLLGAFLGFAITLNYLKSFERTNGDSIKPLSILR